MVTVILITAIMIMVKTILISKGHFGNNGYFGPE